MSTNKAQGQSVNVAEIHWITLARPIICSSLRLMAKLPTLAYPIHCCDHNVTLVHFFVICTRTLHVDLCIIETWAKPDNTASYYYNGLLLRHLRKCVCHQNTLYHSVTKLSYSSIWCKKIKCNTLKKSRHNNLFRNQAKCYD